LKEAASQDEPEEGAAVAREAGRDQSALKSLHLIIDVPLDGVSLPLTLFFYLFGQYASYRARRYRLSRTVWRGVRFWMEKDAWKYAFLSTALFVRSVVTLWIANPWRVAALERFKMRRTRYGHIQAGFEGTGWACSNRRFRCCFRALSR
jgi:uncharacterized membrane protein YjgN (DUF898 family)